MGQSNNCRRRGAEAGHGLAVLGHELANVLTGISGAASMLRETRLDADQERWLEAIETSVAQMEFLVRSARRGSESRARTGSRDVKRLNGVRFLEQLVTAHLPAARKKGIRLLLAIDPRLPTTWRCPGGLLRQVLDNLLGNAVKFNGAGDIIVYARAIPGNTLSLSVADNGPGIDSADLERIFEAYQRGRDKSRTPGSGLGLHVCRSIVADMDGTIQCRSLPGRGTEFTLDLPGVVQARTTVRIPSRALATVRCTLELDGPLAEVTGMLLDRIGVAWCRGSHACGETETDSLSILLRSAAGRDGRRDGTLLLQPQPGTPTVLKGSVLPSVLEAALLRLVLEWRWEQLSLDDRPG